MGNTSPHFVSLPEVAARLGIAWPTAYKRLLRGEFGPVQRFGGRYLIAAEDLEAYLTRTQATVSAA